MPLAGRPVNDDPTHVRCAPDDNLAVELRRCCRRRRSEAADPGDEGAQFGQEEMRALQGMSCRGRAEGGFPAGTGKSRGRKEG
jgi:hypothetical protein